MMKRANDYKIVLMDETKPFTACWELEHEYGKLGRGIGGYRDWASGEGNYVRHLCSNKKCINPLHLLKGSNKENYNDEVMRCAVLCKILHNKGMTNERYRLYIEKFVGRLKFDIDFNYVVFWMSMAFKIDGAEIRRQARRNYSIIVSTMIDDEFNKEVWKEPFNSQVKKALKLWEMINNNDEILILKYMNCIQWNLKEE